MESDNGRLLEIGALLRDFRMAEDVSQQDVAAGIGMSDAWLSQVERGELDVPLSRLVALAEHLGAELVIRKKNPDAQATVEEALESDGQLTPAARGVVLAAYRAARIETPQMSSSTKRRASSRSRVEQRTRGTRSLNLVAPEARASR